MMLKKNVHFIKFKELHELDNLQCNKCKKLLTKKEEVKYQDLYESDDNYDCTETVYYCNECNLIFIPVMIITLENKAINYMVAKS